MILGFPILPYSWICHRLRNLLLCHLFANGFCTYEFWTFKQLRQCRNSQKTKHEPPKSTTLVMFKNDKSNIYTHKYNVYIIFNPQAAHLCSTQQSLKDATHIEFFLTVKSITNLISQAMVTLNVATTDNSAWVNYKIKFWQLNIITLVHSLWLVHRLVLKGQGVTADLTALLKMQSKAISKNAFVTRNTRYEFMIHSTHDLFTRRQCFKVEQNCFSY